MPQDSSRTHDSRMVFTCTGKFVYSNAKQHAHSFASFELFIMSTSFFNWYTVCLLCVCAVGRNKPSRAQYYVDGTSEISLLLRRLAGTLPNTPAGAPASGTTAQHRKSSQSNSFNNTGTGPGSAQANANDPAMWVPPDSQVPAESR